MPTTIHPRLALAEELFATLAAETAGPRGIRRDSYGAGEQRAHDLVAAAAATLDLEVATDPALNLYMTLPGARRDLPRVVIGSHLDSVEAGGNFDGAAGVLAGLAVAAGYRDAGLTPERDITVAAIRCEEAHWFDGPYVGASLALGRLGEGHLDQLRRADTGRTLASHIEEWGGDVAALRAGHAHIDPATVEAYLELHIEQAPVLVERDLPVGLVTGIRGYRRYPAVGCVGAYGHSGALPRRYRRDAVAAAVALIHRLQEVWERIESGEGRDLVFTVGRIATHPDRDGPSKVAGEVTFSLDFRSTDAAVLDEVVSAADAIAAEVAARHRVRFDFGARSDSTPAVLDADLRAQMAAVARREAIATMEMASGAGHDAAAFAQAGVPTAMIFVRNEGGSHNPDEAMEMADFAVATRLLTHLAAERAGRG